MKKQYHALWAFVVGAIVGSTLVHFLIHSDLHYRDRGYSHPIGYADAEEEVHVHSDFVIFLQDRVVDLSEEKYMTTAEQTLHTHIHLHDGDDDVIHRHDHGITLEDFVESLGFALDSNCITDSRGEEFCSNEENTLAYFVNGEQIENGREYVNQEEDKILIFYGDIEDMALIEELQNQITDDSCYYSGTCPERGVAPAESCGLTCEL